MAAYVMSQTSTIFCGFRALAMVDFNSPGRGASGGFLFFQYMFMAG
jgi:hypothetical protein